MLPNDEHNCTDDNELIADIEKFGWIVLSVEASEYLPGFTYTVGLWKNYNHPELIVFGLSSKTLQAVLNTGSELVKSGIQLQANKIYNDFFNGGSAQFLDVNIKNIKDYFGYGLWFNKHEGFPALQLVWTDRNDRFPWEPDFENKFEHRQPLLDRNVEFKFREAKNLAVFTTRQWIELNKPIIRVIHEQDGDWQFLTGDQMPEDVKVVALEQIVLRDATLNDIFNLDYGEEAEREEIAGLWTRNKIKNNEK